MREGPLFNEERPFDCLPERDDECQEMARLLPDAARPLSTHLGPLILSAQRLKLRTKLPFRYALYGLFTCFAQADA